MSYSWSAFLLIASGWLATVTWTQHVPDVSQVAALTENAQKFLERKTIICFNTLEISVC